MTQEERDRLKRVLEDTPSYLLEGIKKGYEKRQEMYMCYDMKDGVERMQERIDMVVREMQVREIK